MSPLRPDESTGGDRLTNLLANSIRRRSESVRLYRPRPEQFEFHLSRASEKVLRGGVRSGKTCATVLETASAAMGIPLCGPDGDEIPFLYPKGTPLLIWVIGYDQKHIARLFRKFFMPGMFRVIKDRETGKMRTWRPWDQEDLDREAETEPSPPIIPPRFCDPETDISYEDKGERIFTVARIEGGTEIHAFASGAAPGQGEAVDIILIDEDIKFYGHVPEWQSRLSDATPVFLPESNGHPKMTLRGRLLWSAWPHTKNNALIDMARRAQEQRNHPNPDVFEKVLWMSKNPYIAKDEVRKRLAGWGPTVSRSRDRGEFLLDTIQVFPDFDVDVHGVHGSGCPKPVLDELKENHFVPPNTWTHYLGLDCGIAQPCILAAAVPPPGLGEFVVIYDEIYLPRMTADALAKEAARRYGSIGFDRFVIDYRAGRQTQVAGMTQEESYATAFDRYHLRCRRTRSHFDYGMDNVTARNEIIRDWLRVRDDRTTKFLCVEDNTPNMRREFESYSKRIVREEATDNVVDSHNDAMDTLGYLAGLDPVWVPHDPGDEPHSKVYATFLREQDRGRNREKTVYMGPGVPDPKPLISV